METINRCLICHKQIKTFKTHILATTICKNCLSQFKFVYINNKINGVPVLYVYKYNEFFRNILLQIKANGDIALAPILIGPAKSYLKSKYRKYIFLPAPSTEKSNNKRGFIHLNEILKPLNIPILNAFFKTANYKQSNMKKYERSNIKNVISLDYSLLDHHNKYCIVDDVVTTGQTIKTCIKLLKDFGVKKINVLILAKKEK